jgi:hypothetical protein
MSNAMPEFINQLKSLGFEVQDHGDGKVSIPYVIPTGKFADKSIRLGFQIPNDFNLTPPSGPHITPELLPRLSGGTHPSGGINESPFGPGWQYWSRPMQHWAQTTRTVKDLLAHVRHLFDTQ